MKENVVFIGFMAVGKSTIARMLAKKLSTFVIDTDDMIEQTVGKKIKDIFAEDGEPVFRQMERDCGEWLENNVKNSIIASGGGFFNVPNIKKIGKVIYLKSSFDGIMARLKKSACYEEEVAKRPLLQDFDTAKNLLESRTEGYENAADVVLDIEDLSYEEVVEKIAAEL